MKNHVDIVHEGKRPYLCTLCGAKYTTNQILRCHIETVYEGKKPWPCGLCDSAFGDKGPFIYYVITFL